MLALEHAQYSAVDCILTTKPSRCTQKTIMLDDAMLAPICVLGDLHACLALLGHPRMLRFDLLFSFLFLFPFLFLILSSVFGVSEGSKF